MDRINGLAVMKTTTLLFTAALWAGACCVAALAEGAPKIQFDKTVYDFGKVTQVETVSGIFKFKNVGEGTLKLEPPKPSCGCTIAGLKPDTLKPGESGELAFTLSLGHYKTLMEKHISVKSNDPLTPDILLTIKVDYTPLYDINPMTLAPSLPLGINVTNVFTTLTRTDGKPLHIVKLDPSKTWITAQIDPAAKADASTARVLVEIRRDGSPRRFNEYIQIYSSDQTNSPVSTIYLYGHFMGQLAFSPEVLYWSITDPKKTEAEHPESLITRRVTIRSVDGKPFEIKKPESTLKGVKLEVVRKDSGKVYDLIAKLDNVPEQTVSGNVSFETSVAAQSRIAVPMIVNVYKP
jgi:hypothetical protein